MRELTYKHKQTGSDITIDKFNINSNIHVMKHTINPTIYKYTVRDIPFSEDWELVTESQFTLDELRLLLDVFEKYSGYIVKIHELDKLYDKLRFMTYETEYKGNRG